MADSTAFLVDFRVSPEEMRAHRRSFLTFERLVLFSLLHIVLVLVCLALAFLGNVPVAAFLLGIVGSIGMIAAFVIGGVSDRD